MVKSFLLLIGVWATIAVSAFSQAPQAAPPNRTGPPAPPPPKVRPDDGFLGILDKGIYRNSFFGFTLEVPQEYIVQNRAEIDLYSRAGTDLYKSANERSNKALE